MKFLSIFGCLAVLVCASSVVNAKNYCPRMPKAEKEGDPWYIPEAAYTKDAANKALQDLGAQVNKGVKGRDFLVDNELKMIKGYLYRAYLAEHRRQFEKEDVSLRKAFCYFIREEAFVEH